MATGHQKHIIASGQMNTTENIKQKKRLHLKANVVVKYYICSFREMPPKRKKTSSDEDESFLSKKKKKKTSSIKKRCCAVPVCNALYQPGGDKLTVHRFPKDKNMQELWLAAIHRTDVMNLDHNRVCSQHFGESDYERDLCNEMLGLPIRKILKRGAIPTKNVLPTDRQIRLAKEMKSKPSGRRPSRLSRIKEDLLISSSDVAVAVQQKTVEAINEATESVKTTEKGGSSTKSSSSSTKIISLSAEEKIKRKMLAKIKDLQMQLKLKQDRIRHDNKSRDDGVPLVPRVPIKKEDILQRIRMEALEKSNSKRSKVFLAERVQTIPKNCVVLKPMQDDRPPIILPCKKTEDAMEMLQDPQTRIALEDVCCTPAEEDEYGEEEEHVVGISLTKVSGFAANKSKKFVDLPRRKCDNDLVMIIGTTDTMITSKCLTDNLIDEANVKFVPQAKQAVLDMIHAKLIEDRSAQTFSSHGEMPDFNCILDHAEAIADRNPLYTDIDLVATKGPPMVVFDSISYKLWKSDIGNMRRENKEMRDKLKALKLEEVNKSDRKRSVARYHLDRQCARLQGVLDKWKEEYKSLMDWRQKRLRKERFRLRKKKKKMARRKARRSYILDQIAQGKMDKSALILVESRKRLPFEKAAKTPTTTTSTATKQPQASTSKKVVKKKKVESEEEEEEEDSELDDEDLSNSSEDEEDETAQAVASITEAAQAVASLKSVTKDFEKDKEQ